MAAISIAGLTRRHPGAPRPALDGLDLEVREGEILVIVGPSGCGKSTALRLVAGLDTPDAGTVTIAGRDVTAVAPQDRDVAMVFQGYALYPHLRVRDNMGFPLKMRGLGKADRNRRVEETAAMLGLTGMLDRLPAELSGGERQRVAMGRAIVRSPRAFLFDEPLSNLDAALRAELRVEIAALVRRLGTTSLYVTHDQVEAMTMGDRVAVLRDGRLQQVGTPREVYERPVNAFVAGFVGTPPMNLVELERDGARARRAGFDLPLSDNGTFPARLKVGIRPEHLVLSGDGAAGATISATVTAIEPLGAETYVYLDASGARLIARAHGFDAPERGEVVQATVDPRRVHWFDAETGARLAS